METFNIYYSCDLHNSEKWSLLIPFTQMRKLKIKETNLSKFNITKDYLDLLNYEILAFLATVPILAKEKCFNFLY